MVISRTVFQLEFGAARQAIALMKQSTQIGTRLGLPGEWRLLTDITGEMYTLVMEVGVERLALFEEGQGRLFADAQHQEIRDRMNPLVRSARKDMFQVVDLMG